MLETVPRCRYAFPLLAYAFAAIMVGTALPTPMYALYGERMHFSVLTTTVIYATYAGGVLFALLCFGRWSDAIGTAAGVAGRHGGGAALSARGVSVRRLGAAAAGRAGAVGSFGGYVHRDRHGSCHRSGATRVARPRCCGGHGRQRRRLGCGPLLAGRARSVRASIRCS